MTDSDRSEATVAVVSSLSEISRDDWDACANPAGATSAGAAEFNPFLSHDFLWSLEESGSATGKTGWLSQKLSGWREGPQQKWELHDSTDARVRGRKDYRPRSLHKMFPAG